jgi:UDP-glucuronate 4-epimerase
MKVLVTGAAGFIGFHTVRRLLDDGHEVVGLDNLNDYYDPELKHARLAKSGIDRERIRFGEAVPAREGNYRFYLLPLEDREAMKRFFDIEGFDRVCHLAAQAGVRYSLENPYAYVDSNLSGFITVLEGCRHQGVEHLVYASSSSVYGMNPGMPFSVHDRVDHPVSLYAATKKANELMAHTYSHLHGLPATGLRFFTVYGPWGRPDMAYYLFTRKIAAGEPIDVFNNGEMKRDFTFIDDIVEGVLRVIKHAPAKGAPSEENPSGAPHRIYNIGNDRPETLMDFIRAIERALGMEAKKNYLPMQPGDVPATWADVSDLERETGYRPSTPLDAGIERFVQWYRSYHVE